MEQSAQCAPKCATCMDLRYWEKADLPTEMRSDFWTISDDMRFGFRRYVRDIEASASSCGICAILFEGLKLAEDKQNIHLPADGEVSIDAGLARGVTVQATSYGRNGIEFYTSEEADIPYSIPFFNYPHVSPIMDSKLAAQKARGWLERCRKSHPRCSRGGKPFLPKRVIRLVPNSNPQLYESHLVERGDYIALSYCWGTSKQYKTVKDNISSNLAGIRWDDIPKTQSEAMQFALDLGIEFIWIDALCIIQDDDEDWKKQALQMGAIYQNTLLTISATASKDTQGGCFIARTGQNQSYKVQNRLSSLGDIDIYVRTKCQDTHHALFEGDGGHIRNHERSLRFPVLPRGWTFQERILSGRMLHCGPEELAWECLSSIHCECSSRAEFGLVGIPEAKMSIEAHLKDNSHIWSRTNHPLHKWKKLVTSYSQCEFTYPTDRMIALQGIADRFETLNLGPYLYGLWGKDLAYQLDWVAAIQKPHRRRLDLPTWSWASIYGPCIHSYDCFKDFQPLSLCEVDLVNNQTLVISSDAIDATIVLKKSLFEPAEMSAQIGDENFEMSGDIHQWTEGSIEREDIQPEERLAHGDPVVCMELSTYIVTDDGHNYVRRYLVLRESSTEGLYRRIGMLEIMAQVATSNGDEVPAMIQGINGLSRKRTVRVI